jgi:hypothetical protein
MSGQHWNVFGNCPTCRARPGEPCRDMRTFPINYLRERPETKRAHLNREQLAVPLPVRNGGDTDPRTYGGTDVSG